jgi:dihydroorotase
MSLIIKNATISDPRSPYHGKKADLFIHNGIIERIGRNLKEAARLTLTGKDIHVTPGWVDIMADYCDPGYEHKETIHSGLDAAAAGGFTDVFVVPNTQPAITGKSILEYVLTKGGGHKVKLHAYGAISKNLEGKDLAEMLDMYHNGAVAFSDGWKPVQHAGLMVKALEYVKAFDGVLVQVPILASLAQGGLMHEGETSVRLGMSGIPAIAESILVQRDLELLRYTGSRLHFSGITTVASLSLIRAAKKEGLKVTCSVTPYHLLYTDQNLGQYNSVFKVEPPLRTEAERKALVKALSDGTVDCIATHHRPQDWDAKVSEFEYAQPGMISQETCFAMLQLAAPKIEMERWAELLSIKAREIFNLPQVSVAEGHTAAITVVDRMEEWTYNTATKKSLAVNSPLIETTLRGKILAI